MAHRRKKYSYNVWLTSTLGDNVVRVNADSEAEAVKIIKQKNPTSVIRIVHKRTKADMLAEYEKSFGV